MKRIVRPCSVSERIGEQLDHFLWREHGGRLVQDEDARLAIERLQDLDALLLADGEPLDGALDIDRKAEALGERLHRLGGALAIQLQPGARLDAEHDVLGDREGGNEREMLEHHPDARRDGGARRMKDDRLAVEEDLSGIGLLDAEQDLHQRRLAGAVLADHGVDRAGRDGKIDVLVGVNAARIGLVDPAGFENEGHRVRNFRRPALPGTKPQDRDEALATSPRVLKGEQRPAGDRMSPVARRAP